MTVTNVTPAVITGTPSAGQVLTTSDGTWDHDEPNLSFAYQWLRCDASGNNCTSIAGATAKTYQVTNADVTHTLRARVTASESTPAPGGTLIWSGDFDTGDESQFDAIIRWTASEFLVCASDSSLGPTVTPRQGSHMARCQCVQGHPAPWASSLCASFAIKASTVTNSVGYNKTYTDVYMGFSCWVPLNYDWEDSSMHSTIGEWHGLGSMSQAPIHLGILGNGSNAGKWFIDLHRAVTGYSPVFQTAFDTFGAATADQWVDFVIRTKWSNGADGRVQCWMNGVLKKDYTGPTAPISGETIKPQLGLYKKNTTPNSTIYVDSWRVGTTYDVVDPANY